MNSEADQPVSQDPEAPGSVRAEASGAPVPVVRVPAAKAARPRAGVPVWRTGKPDAFLAAAVDTARAAIEGITAASDIGRHLAAKSEGDRLVTHLFESKLPGYAGWQWFAVLTRNSRSKVVTVSELGLLPSENSILAPEWVPWAERVRPEDEQEPEVADEEAGNQETDSPAADASTTQEPEASAANASAAATAGEPNAQEPEAAAVPGESSGDDALTS